MFSVFRRVLVAACLVVAPWWVVSGSGFPLGLLYPLPLVLVGVGIPFRVGMVAAGV